MKCTKLFSLAAVATVSTAAAVPALADLTFNEAITESGTGIGKTATLLTTKPDDGNTVESGCVAWNGAADVVGPAACPAGYNGIVTQTGASQTLTRTLGEVDIDVFGALGIVLNVNQAGPVQLVAMEMRVYPPDSGTPCFIASLDEPGEYSGQGVGASGYFFTLTPTQTSTANTGCPGPDRSGYRVGLAANLSQAKGGHEVFFLANTNPPPVTTLCILKSILNGNPETDFAFTGDVAIPAPGLSDGEQYCQTVTADQTYEVAETVPTGWDVPDISCNEDEQYWDRTDDSVVEVTVPEGATVTCTFVNSETPVRTGQICVNKVVTAGSQSQEFPFDIFNDTYSTGFSLSHGDQECVDVTGGAPGQGIEYTVAETVPSGWIHPPTVNCGDGDVNQSSVSVSVEEDEQVSCTFTNALDFGSLTVIKTVDGPTPASDWSFTWTGGGSGDGFSLPAGGGNTTIDDLVPGDVYTVAETRQDNYVPSVQCTPNGASGSAEVSFTVEPGQNSECTFTNRYETPPPPPAPTPVPALSAVGIAVGGAAIGIVGGIGAWRRRRRQARKD